MMCRYGASVKNASKVVFDIYKAFNVAGLVDSALNEVLQKESDAVFEKIWSGLYTWEDWKNITVTYLCNVNTHLSVRENPDMPFALYIPQHKQEFLL